jgi:hypothetical protein
MNYILLALGACSCVVAVFGAGDTVADVKACMKKAHETCVSNCISQVPAAKQAAVKTCIQKSSLESAKAAFEQCLSTQGITDTTPCFKFGGHGDGKNGHGHGNGAHGKHNHTSNSKGHDANVSNDMKAFHKCTRQCMKPHKDNACTTNCAAATAAQQTALKTCKQQLKGTANKQNFEAMKDCLKSALP